MDTSKQYTVVAKSRGQGKAYNYTIKANTGERTIITKDMLVKYINAGLVTNATVSAIAVLLSELIDLIFESVSAVPTSALAVDSAADVLLSDEPNNLAAADLAAELILATEAEAKSVALFEISVNVSLTESVKLDAYSEAVLYASSEDTPASLRDSVNESDSEPDLIAEIASEAAEDEVVDTSLADNVATLLVRSDTVEVILVICS